MAKFRLFAALVLGGGGPAENSNTQEKKRDVGWEASSTV